VYDPDYLDIKRTDGMVIIQITLASGRTVEQKKALFSSIVKLLAAKQGVRQEDILLTSLRLRAKIGPLETVRPLETALPNTPNAPALHLAKR
jgi:hypothetical protein